MLNRPRSLGWFERESSLGFGVSETNSGSIFEISPRKQSRLNKVRGPASRGALPEGFAHYLFINPAARAASSQLSVDHNGRKTADTMLRGKARHFVLTAVQSCAVCMIAPNFRSTASTS